MPVIYNMDMEKQNENTDSPTLLQHSVIAVVQTEISVSLNSPLIKGCQVADVYIHSHLSHENDEEICNFFTSSAFWRKRLLLCNEVSFSRKSFFCIHVWVVSLEC